MPTWPAGLPQNLERTGFKEQRQQQIVMTSMEVGPPKRRRRFTAAKVEYTGRIIIDDTQKATLDTFFDTTCSGGALSFTWIDPISGASADFYFKEAPSITALGAAFVAVLKLEKLP